MKTKNIFSVFSGLACALPLAFAGFAPYADGGLQRADAPKLCGGYDECRYSCSEIYRHALSVRDCAELGSENISAIWHVYEKLQDPISVYDDDIDGVYDRLYDEYSSDFMDNLRLLLEISPDPLFRLAKRYVSWEAKKMLAWIAASKQMAEVIHNVDSGRSYNLDTADFDILKSLFEKARMFGGAEGWRMQRFGIEGGLFDIIADNDNEAAFDYIHSFLMSDSGCPGCEASHERRFNNYCSAFDSFNVNILNPRTAGYLLDFNSLERYLDGVIANKVNKASWSDQHFKASRDLSDDWWKELCSPMQQEEEQLKGLAEELVEAVGTEKAIQAIQNMIEAEKKAAGSSSSASQ